MNYRSMFPKQYLAAEDLDGREVTLTIAKLEREKVKTDSGTEQKWTIHFQEMLDRVKRDPNAINKRLIANITQARMIAKLYGNETDNWIGERITIYPTTCNAFGDPHTPCIRIRDRVPPPKEQREPDAPDQVPAEDPNG